MANQPAAAQAPASAGSGPVNAGGAGGPTFRMRAIDGGLATVVYWDSAIIDKLGVDYGGPGPLSDVVVSEVIGAAP